MEVPAHCNVVRVLNEILTPFVPLEDMCRLLYDNK